MSKSKQNKQTKKKTTGFKEMRRILKNSSSSIRVENLRTDRIRVKGNGFQLELILFPGTGGRGWGGILLSVGIRHIRRALAGLIRDYAA